MSIVVVTGTGTDVGKTVATAALAAAFAAEGHRVRVVKPAQTGYPEDHGGDLADIGALTGITDLHGYARYPEPMAPLAAARRAGMPTLARADVADRIRALDAPGTVVLVEGAGGLLVRIGEDAGGTWALPDLAELLPGAATVVVTGLELGCLNAAELTVEVARARGMRVAGLIGGSLPDGGADDPIIATNITDLPALTGTDLLAVVPAGSGRLDRGAFTAAAPGWFGPAGRRFTASESTGPAS